MNRFDFQKLADIRIQEAEGLLKLGLSDGAYYLAGYAVECALKACIAKNIKEFDYPPKNANAFYVHDLDKLLELARLTSQRDSDFMANSKFKFCWQKVSEWSEQSRYEEQSLGQATDLIEAITNPTDGVLTWVKKYW